TLAAVDLGSNSFHLEIGRVVERQIYPLDAVREVVRLGGGLTADKRIDRATQARALESLAKLAARLRGFPPQGGRAGGANAARGEERAPVPARGAPGARLSDRGDLGAGRSAAHLPRRGARAAGLGAPAPGGRRGRRARRIH